MKGETLWDWDAQLYRDTGCDLHPSCLACPLEVCRYDATPGNAITIQRAARERELSAQGWTVPAIARELGVHVRTVYRLRNRGAVLPVVASTSFAATDAR